ncbi:MAG: hypothetical protein AAGE80_09655 [Pseudomonadota bacterium]
MVEYCDAYAKFLAKQKCTGAFVAKAREIDQGIRIEAGPASFAMRALNWDWVEPYTHDFAAFGLAALSLTNGWHITLDTPVSLSLRRQIDGLSKVYRLWSLPRLSALRLDMPDVVDPPAHEGRLGRIVCLSGGIDSVFAAITAKTRQDLAAGLIISGADYPCSRSPGFAERRRRVSAIADILGVPLYVVETDIRKAGYDWEMVHAFNLACCLHFCSGSYASGGYAYDWALHQEVFRNVVSNQSGLNRFFSTDGFALHGYGRRHNRIEKLAAIAAHDPALTRHISVCWENNEGGGNCGHCKKCVETRLAFHALGIPDEDTFDTREPLVDLIGRLTIGQGYTSVVNSMLRITELVDAMPKGPIRAALCDFEQTLRQHVFERHPLRGY